MSPSAHQYGFIDLWKNQVVSPPNWKVSDSHQAAWRDWLAPSRPAEHLPPAPPLQRIRYGIANRPCDLTARVRGSRLEVEC